MIVNLEINYLLFWPLLWITYGSPFSFRLSEIIPICLSSKITISPGCQDEMSSMAKVKLSEYFEKNNYLDYGKENIIS